MSEVQNKKTFDWENIKNYLEEKPQPIIGNKTIQILMVRETLDYAALRTEDTKELNILVIPTSLEKPEQVTRVAFLGQKQKAAETREMERILRTALQANAISIEDKLEFREKGLLKKTKECYLKDKLCCECPRCILHGATALSSEANIKHRIEYSTATSLLPWNDIEENITFNAINDKDIKTGQALGTRYLVKPASLFPSIVTLKSVTKDELILVIKTLLSCKSYGAETRVSGDMRNHIVGIVAGWEEIITSLEFTLGLYDKMIVGSDNAKTATTSLLETFKNYAGNKSKVYIEKKFEQLVEDAQDTQLDINFLSKVYKDANNFRNSQK